MRAWNKVRKHIGKHHESTKTKRKTHTTAILMQWHIFLTRKTTKAYNYKIWGRSIVIQPSEPNLSQHQTNEQLRLLCYIVPRDPKQWDVYEHVGQWPVAHQCTHKGSPISPMLITTIPAPTPHLVTGGNFFQGITKYISTIRKIRKNMQWLSWKIFPCDTHCIILWLLSVKYFNFHKNIPLNISWQSIKYFNQKNLKNIQWLSWKIFPCDTHCIILWLLSVKYLHFHENIFRQSTKYFWTIRKIWKKKF